MMAHPHVNIVYRNLPKASAVRLERPALGLTFEWSNRELEQADTVVYVNSYSYDRRRTQRCSPRQRILFIAEPVVVHPNQYTQSCWRDFDALIACNPLLAEESHRFHYLPVVNYGYPFPSGHGLAGERPSPDQMRSRIDGLCQVCGWKTSLLSPELYSLRRSVASWFALHSSVPCDVYGHPPMPVPNYRGIADSKLATLSRYRYALCFENCYDPRWSAGYLTEKIFDCFHAGTVPIYKGCYDVEQYVPAQCFIDYRKFAGPAELERHLRALSFDDYLAYVHNAWAFLDSYRPQETLHADRLYELIAGIHATQHAVTSVARTDTVWPVDFLASGPSTRDRIAFVLSCCVLRFPWLFRMLSKLSTLPAKVMGSARQSKGHVAPLR